MPRRHFIRLTILVAVLFIAVLPMIMVGFDLRRPNIAADVANAANEGSWERVMRALRRGPGQYVVIHPEGDISERLRVVGSGLAVADGIQRSLLVVWVLDGNCSCRLTSLLSAPLSFEVLEIDVPRDAPFSSKTILPWSLPQTLATPPGDVFQVYDYIADAKRAADDAEHNTIVEVTLDARRAKKTIARAPVAPPPPPTKISTTPRLHLFFRSQGELLNHPQGLWPATLAQLGRLTLRSESDGGVVASAPLPKARRVGVHLCPQHSPRGPAPFQVFGSDSLELMQLPDEAPLTDSAASAGQRFPHVTAFPPRANSCSAAGNVLAFLRSTSVVLFVSPETDAADSSRREGCGTPGLAASGTFMASIRRCPDACCCQEACRERKRCVGWQFYTERDGTVTRCYLKSTDETEASPGNWGGIFRRNATTGEVIVEEDDDEAAGNSACYEKQSALQASLAPWLKLRAPSIQPPDHRGLPGRPGARPPALRDVAPAVPASGAGTGGTTPSQSTFLFWLRRSGVDSKFGQDEDEARAARVAALPSTFNDTAPQRFAISALMELSPTGIETPGSGHDAAVLAAVRTKSWAATAAALNASRTKYIIVDAKNGLGNRMRAIASAMAFAHSTWRPLLVIWAIDRHCSCGLDSMFSKPYPFALLEADVDTKDVDEALFEVSDYMDPTTRGLPVSTRRDKHIYFKSGYLIAQMAGSWTFAQSMLHRLTPVPVVQKLLIANRSMVGVHVRTVFDAPLTTGAKAPKDVTKKSGASGGSTTGAAALALAAKEYGGKATESLLLWRKASHWSNFVGKMKLLISKEREERGAAVSKASPLFYLAADSHEAYQGLSRALPPGKVVFTKRNCAAERCDLRDCDAMIYSLVDMLNLARTKFILGSSWSSYSEVASYWGGNGDG